MLSTQEIAKFMDNPQGLSSEHIADLNSLADKHPYCQLFSILLLKNLANTKDVTFEEKLAQHSYRVSDRVQLYNLIHQFESDKVEQTIPEVATTETTSVAIEPIEEEIVEEKDKVIIEDVEEKAHLDEKSLEKVSETPSPDTQDKLDESILHNAYAANFTLEDLTEEEETARLERENKVIEKETETPVEGIPEAQEDPSLSFTSWLHADENYHESSNIEKEAINAVVSDFKDFDPLAELSGEIEKPKTEFFSPTKKAKKSLDEQTLPVSETLAKIYYMQGNYPKAIEAYQQLSLKYPEKKIFFANLIEDLQKKLNT